MKASGNDFFPQNLVVLLVKKMVFKKVYSIIKTVKKICNLTPNNVRKCKLTCARPRN